LEAVRIDKWLWSVRIFKTRTKATEACKSNNVRIEDIPVKPSREIRIGEEITIKFGPIIRKVKVVNLLEKRIAAAKVPYYMEDLTPEDEYVKLKMTKSKKFEFRDRGLGRPTKKQRRDIEKLKKIVR